MQRRCRCSHKQSKSCLGELGSYPAILCKLAPKEQDDVPAPTDEDEIEFKEFADPDNTEEAF